MASLQPDQIIGSYRVIRLIGQGGMGAVYESVHAVLGHRVALKVLTCDTQSDATLAQRFFNEARAAGQINHAGIVRVHDIGQVDARTPWMALEFLDGESLSARMAVVFRQTGRAMSMDDCLWIIGEVASALDAAHEKGIIHRDLKPANIMLVPDPATLHGERAKVLDFGIAKLAHEGTLTQSGAMMGTSLYMALEQFRNAAEVDGKADVFSLGVILYQCLTGRLPHAGDTPYAVMGARLLDPITPIVSWIPDLPPEVARLAMAMLEREPAARPTMREVEQAIRRLRGLPPPRASGFHAATAGASPTILPVDAARAGPVPLPVAGNASGPTADIPVLAVSAVPLSLPTPSGQTAAKPPFAEPLAVPDSLSSMPSVPVPLGPMRAGPAAQTASALPAALTPAAQAPPSVPTQKAPMLPGWLRRLAVAAFLMAVFAGSIWLRGNPRPEEPAHADLASPQLPSLQGSIEMNPSTVPLDAAVSARHLDSQDAAVPEPAKKLDASPAASGSASSPVEKPSDKPSDSKPPKHAKSCDPLPPSLSWIKSPQQSMNPVQREAILAALQDSGIKLCPGDELTLVDLPHKPRIASAPTAVLKTAQTLLVPALRGALPDGPFPAKVVVSCPPR